VSSTRADSRSDRPAAASPALFTTLKDDVQHVVGEMQRRALELYLDGGDAAEEEALVTDVGDRLAEISVPTLVLVGELDVPDMQTIAARLQREIPNARGATIAGAAHAPTMESPDEFTGLVLRFLDEAGEPA
jgi:pimeloyl-ACP methyl ester carboxylesterase